MPQEQDKHQSSPPPENPPSNLPPQGEEKNRPVNYYLLVEAGIEFAIYIGLPLYAFIKLGKWADAKFGTKYLVLIGIFLALSFSSYLIYRKINQFRKLLK